MVTGTGHSAWGRFYVSGRVRVWDGMILLMKEYYVSPFLDLLISSDDWGLTLTFVSTLSLTREGSGSIEDT